MPSRIAARCKVKANLEAISIDSPRSPVSEHDASPPKVPRDALAPPRPLRISMSAFLVAFRRRAILLRLWQAFKASWWRLPWESKAQQKQGTAFAYGPAVCGYVDMCVYT